MRCLILLNVAWMYAHHCNYPRSSTTPVQKIVTTAKGVAIDYDNVSRETQAYSKELYVWGQTEQDDVKDGT